MSKEDEGKTEKGYLNTIIESLSYLAKEKMYGPLDVLASTPDPQLAYGVLYNAIRYLASQEYPIPSEDDLNALFAIAKKQPEVLREVAIKALIRGTKRRIAIAEERHEIKNEEKEKGKNE